MRFPVREPQQNETVVGQNVPRLKMLNHSRFDVRVLLQKIVQAVDVGDGDLFDVFRSLIELLLSPLWHFKHAIQHITTQSRRPNDLGVTPDGLNIGVFYLPEVVLALTVSHTKGNRRISGSRNVRDAPFITTNGDALSHLLGSVFF